MRAVSLAVSLLAGFAVGEGSSARADDAPLRLMHEPIPYTDVVDAFDAHDRFDINIHLDYTHLNDRGTLEREVRDTNGVIGRQQVGASNHDRNLLTLEVDVGLWRDVMAFVRIPLVLSDTRAIQGSPSSALASGNGAPLFALPATSPSRAGLDFVAFGGAWSVLNQARASWQPTWVLRAEGRRAIGRPLRPCIVRQGTVCGTQSSEDRDGDGELDVTRGEPGISAGLSALLVETRFSRRSRHVEPYAGLALLVQWPSTARERFQPDGQGRARPGPESTATLGAALIPWEDRGSYQRVTFDLRLDVTYVARGTTYSPLFDALGTSSAPSLAGAPGHQGFQGLSEADQHLRYGGQLGVELQAARYVRFAAGTSARWVTEHALTDRGPCDTSRCSPLERHELDSPGHRFFIRDQLLLGIYAQATATF